MLHSDADIHAHCGGSGEEMMLHVRDGGVVDEECICHFALPVRQWWDDIGFT